jgi:succinate-semialdehyde dehydrogenase / glutarate-semialdehyde dehydrogenase
VVYQTINPSNEQTIEIFLEHTDKQLEELIAQAQSTYQLDWSRRTLDERSRVLKNCASILRNGRADFAGLLTLEMGKLLREARDEVDLSADIFDYFADNGEKFLAPKHLEVEEGGAVVENAPLGVIFCVEPWNFPYYHLARIAGPNLMVGNTLIVKHAPNVPQSALAFEKLFLDAGAPVGTYTNVFLSSDEAAVTIADSRIRGVALTGDERAATAVAAQAGKALKKSTMELAGNDAFIVLDDADMDTAIKWAVWGKTTNAGQCCIAAKRFILDEKVADVFISRFSKELSKLTPGDPRNDKTTLAPLSSQSALELVERQITAAVDAGAKLLMGGRRLQCSGYFLQPTILTNIAPNNPAYYEELCAPVALIFRVKNEDEAIKLANDSPYGLGAAVITRNVERGKRIARRIEAGMIFINRATWTAPNLPFGGVKNSGFGRELSELGIGEFVNKKLIRTV